MGSFDDPFERTALMKTASLSSTRYKDSEDVAAVSDTDLLSPLVDGKAMKAGTDVGHAGIVIGCLVGIAGQGQVPLVLFAGQVGSAAVPARSLRDLQAVHVGKEVALMFEDGDSAKPIILGVLNNPQNLSREQIPGHVEVSADDERLVVTAKKQIVLRCGKASITLTNSGKVLIQGEYVSTRASGVNRIKGGTVQIN